VSNIQVFVPYADLDKIALALDNKRLFKQGVESYQLAGGLTRRLLVTTQVTGQRTLRTGRVVDVVEDLPAEDWTAVPRLNKKGEPGKTWGDHRVGRMWDGHLGFLAQYQHVLMAEWRLRGYAETVDLKLTRLLQLAGVDLLDKTPPPWWGDERVHASHRAALSFKFPEHYTPQWDDAPAYDYYWPT
jgi:hypothetical protein